MHAECFRNRPGIGMSLAVGCGGGGGGSSESTPGNSPLKHRINNNEEGKGSWPVALWTIPLDPPLNS